MSDLSNTIYQYYLVHFAALSPEKQFHFAARLQLWSQDGAAGPLLEKLKPWMTAHDQPVRALEGVIAAARTAPYRGISAATLERRRPFFETYPELRPASLALLRVTFLLSVYGIDIRDELYRFFPREQLDELRDRLLQDEAGLRTLSTYAVADFLYLYERVLVEDEEGLPVERFLRLGKGYDLRTDTDFELYLYFFTHCIIGESIFYWRRPRGTYLLVYRAMLEELERALSERFERVKLDNKFEFLVACKLCDYSTTLVGRIEEEAVQSLSPRGDFLIDRQNVFSKRSKHDLEGSEHRNILYIMAHREFRPLV